MSLIPGRESFSQKEWRLIQSLRKPPQVQRFLSSMPYNWERNGGTLRSFREIVQRNEAHCLEAAVSITAGLDVELFRTLRGFDGTDKRLWGHEPLRTR